VRSLADGVPSGFGGGRDFGLGGGTLAGSRSRLGFRDFLGQRKAAKESGGLAEDTLVGFTISSFTKQKIVYVQIRNCPQDFTLTLTSVG
jgi:hypothetical protein